MIPVTRRVFLESVEDGVYFFHFLAIVEDDVVEFLHHQFVDRVSRSVRINSAVVAMLK